MPIARAAKRATVRLSAVALAGALLAACGSGSSGGSSDSAGGKVTLTVDLFGSFGYKEAGLYAEYEKLHPNIKIKQSDTEDEQDYWKSLQTRLAGGGGLADVQGIEVGRIAAVTQQQADKFEDLKKYGADKLKDQFAEAKWSAATGRDGQILGLGTDVGPEAMCYRTDLFKQAGLPTDRTQLAAKWSTWDGYLALGKEYKKKAPAKSAWVDSIGSLYAIMVGQQKERYYDASGKLIYENNPAVKAAWDASTDAAQAGLSAKLDQWSPQWNQAFSAGSFATMPCPAWMLGYIKGQAGDAGKGKWDVAKLPEGAGNWGGSYLSIPRAAEHKKEAYELIQWLTAPEQQAKLFTKQGNFPSSTGAIAKVAAAKDPYFSDAPIGQIFGDAAKAAPVQVLGVHDKNVADQITNALSEVERKGTSPDKAWSTAKKNVENATG
ncbi:extracellular solute-binding protein [Streptomyces sp. NBC_00879]|uniref:extracellular solute-binding protein n=1 Tax=unclassified Streptomyces TaxID=2593676 RepID=UPI00386FCF68|nr:extracellular solute-binding protein [Streptomyces sp. NBC_00885]WSY73504.1 extracellular solute-binding protein [Streptomyces sp. NBC_00879]